MTRGRVLFVFFLLFLHIVLIYAPMPVAWGLNFRRVNFDRYICIDTFTDSDDDFGSFLKR